MRILALAIAVIAATSSSTAQDALEAGGAGDTDWPQLARQLLQPAGRDAARAQLVSGGEPAARALVAVLEENGQSDELAEAILPVLGAMRENAAPLFDRLLDYARHHRGGPFVGLEVSLIRALGDLVPYASTQNLDALSILQMTFIPSEATGIALARLSARQDFGAPEDLDTLQAAVAGRRAFHSELAAELLARRGAAAAGALPALTEALNRPNPRILLYGDVIEVRESAARAILAIAPRGDLAAEAKAVLAGDRKAPAAPPLPGPVAELVARLDRADDPEEQARLLGVLAALGPDAAPAVPTVVESIPDRDVSTLPSALRFLSSAAPWCRDVAMVYLSGSRHGLDIGGRRLPGTPTPEVMTEAFAECSRLYFRTSLDPDAPVRQLIAALASPAVLTREFAIELLGRRGPAARDALPALASLLGAEQPKLHFSERKDDGRFVAGQHSLDDELHDAAARAMVLIDPDDPGAAPGHAHRLGDADADVRCESAMALGRLGAAAVPYVDELVTALRDTDVRVQREAVTSLGMIGPAAKSGVDALRALALGDEGELAARAEVALRRIERD